MCAICLLFFGCTSKKTEREQYENATSGFTYQTYKSASRLAVAASVTSYNYKTPDSLHVQPEYAHLLLGYFWTVSGKSTTAFAEADIAEESEYGNVKYLAQSLRSITMYQQGWHALSKEESIEAKKKLAQQPGTDITYEAAIFYLIMGSVYVKEKDFEQAKFFWAGFGNETDIHWPYQLCDAAADLQAGRIQVGLQKIKIVSQDPSVPKPLRDVLLVNIEKIEQHVGTEVDSSLFWPKVIGTLLWDELRKSADGSIKKITSMIDDVRRKLPA